MQTVNNSAPVQNSQTLGSQTAAAGEVREQTAAQAGQAGANRSPAVEGEKQKFSEVWSKIQADMGEKPKVEREAKKTLGKDDLIRIMVSQLKNQDPTKPFDAEKIAQQLGQITNIEQMNQMGAALSKLSTQNQPLEKLTMTSLIGKWLTFDRNRFTHTEGTKDSLSVQLPEDASQVKVSILGPNGEPIFEKDIGEQKKGSNGFTWDGKNSSGITAKAGNYMFKVEAKDKVGREIQLSPERVAQVIGVSFEGGDPVYVVGDGKNSEKVNMKSVVKVEADKPQPKAPEIKAPVPAAAESQSETKPKAEVKG